MVYADGTNVRAGRQEAIAAVLEVAQLIAPTLGPSGSDVLITNAFGEILTTNDGATILRETPITHPAARIAADIGLSQERSVGDGTTSTVVLAAYLLEELLEQLDKESLRTVLARLDPEPALSIVRGLAIDYEADMIGQVIGTALSGKAAEEHAALLAKLFEAAEGEVHLVREAGKPMSSSEHVDGLLLDHRPVREDMPRTIANARILLVAGALEARRATATDTTTTE